MHFTFKEIEYYKPDGKPDICLECFSVIDLNVYELLEFSRDKNKCYYWALKSQITGDVKAYITSVYYIDGENSLTGKPTFKIVHGFEYEDPREYHCPRSVLDRLTPTTDPRALQWRRKAQYALNQAALLNQKFIEEHQKAQQEPDFLVPALTSSVTALIVQEEKLPFLTEAKPDKVHDMKKEENQTYASTFRSLLKTDAVLLPRSRHQTPKRRQVLLAPRRLKKAKRLPRRPSKDHPSFTAGKPMHFQGNVLLLNLKY
ncbi:MAG: hypothetical protein ACLUYS_07270 [Allobaculum sp.]|uniref:hypothetical protein n=1 Tax=Allobaculum sp. TaxID=1872463 RepID=UPI00399990CC